MPGMPYKIMSIVTRKLEGVNHFHYYLCRQLKGGGMEIFMIYVGIDVAKDKHDCFITNSVGEVLFNSFTISNNRDGFETLFQKIQSVSDDLNKVKVGLEATGHYSYNLLGFLLDKGYHSRYQLPDGCNDHR